MLVALSLRVVIETSMRSLRYDGTSPFSECEDPDIYTFLYWQPMKLLYNSVMLSHFPVVMVISHAEICCIC